MNEIKLLIHEIYNNFESSNYFYEHLIKITNLNIKKCRRRIKENEKILNEIENQETQPHKEPTQLNPYIEKVDENKEEIILYYCYNINNGSTYWQNYKD